MSLEKQKKSTIIHGTLIHFTHSDTHKHQLKETAVPSRERERERGREQKSLIMQTHTHI